MFKPGDRVCINEASEGGWTLDAIKKQFEGKLELGTVYTVETTNGTPEEVANENFWPLLRLAGTPQDYWLDHNWFVAAPITIFKPGENIRLNPAEREKADQLPRVFSWDTVYTVAEVIVNASKRTSIIRLNEMPDYWDPAWFIAA